MSTGPSSDTVEGVLNAIGNATPFSYPEVWIKLHVGDPGATGLSNPATETDRQQASFAAATPPTITTDGALTWASVAATEDYTHWSAHTDDIAGDFIQSGTLTAAPVTAGGTFIIAAGDLTLTMPAAA